MKIITNFPGYLLLNYYKPSGIFITKLLLISWSILNSDDKFVFIFSKKFTENKNVLDGISNFAFIFSNYFCNVDTRILHRSNLGIFCLDK